MNWDGIEWIKNGLDRIGMDGMEWSEMGFAFAPKVDGCRKLQKLSNETIYT